MDLRKILRIALVAEWILVIVNIPASKDNTWVSDVNAIVSLTTGPLILGYLISSIGLFFIKSWAKWSYTIFVVINLLLGFFTGPISVHKHAFSNIIGYLSLIVTAIILYLLFFTNVMPKKKDRAIG